MVEKYLDGGGHILRLGYLDRFVEADSRPLVCSSAGEGAAEHPERLHAGESWQSRVRAQPLAGPDCLGSPTSGQKGFAEDKEQLWVYVVSGELGGSRQMLASHAKGTRPQSRPFPAFQDSDRLRAAHKMAPDRVLACFCLGSAAGERGECPGMQPRQHRQTEPVLYSLLEKWMHELDHGSMP